jgi:hypothetical protein
LFGCFDAKESAIKAVTAIIESDLDVKAGRCRTDWEPEPCAFVAGLSSPPASEKAANSFATPAEGGCFCRLEDCRARGSGS